MMNLFNFLTYMLEFILKVNYKNHMFMVKLENTNTVSYYHYEVTFIGFLKFC